jgi:hypothetical protein
VPGWARRLSPLVPLLVIPSSVWRVPVAFGADMGMVDPDAPPWVWWALPYTLGLIVVTELLAYLSLGLVRPWGVVLPDRVPVVGGHRVPRTAVVIPAAAGGLVATALLVEMVLGKAGLFGLDQIEFTTWWWEAIALGAYLPHNLCGPLVLALTVSYARRRRPARRRAPSSTDGGARAASAGG